MIINVIHKEFKIAFKNHSEILNPLWFFLLILCLFPLALGPDPNTLNKIAPAIIWVATILSALLSFERLFRQDYQDGSLEQLLLSPKPLYLSCLGKIIAHWLITALPIILLCPISALLFNMELNRFYALELSLILGTPSISAIGAIGVGLTVGLARVGVLLSVIVLPLFIPILIFSIAAVDSATFSVSYAPHLAILAAITILSVTLSPFAIAKALRISLN